MKFWSWLIKMRKTSKRYDALLIWGAMWRPVLDEAVEEYIAYLQSNTLHKEKV